MRGVSFICPLVLSPSHPFHFLLYTFHFRLAIVFAEFTADILGAEAVDESSAVVESDRTTAVAAVPEAVVPFGAVRRLVVDEQHIGFVADDIGNHTVEPGALLDMPDDLCVGLVAMEAGAAAGPELREIELERAALVPESGEQLARQRYGSDLRSAAAYIEDRISQLAAGELARQMARREPYPGRSEIASPVLVGIAETVVRTHQIAAAVEQDLTLVGGLHAFGMPEHLEELPTAHRCRSSVAHVERHLFAYLEVPLHLSRAAHPLGVRLSLRRRDTDATGHLGLAHKTIVGAHAERHTHTDLSLLPTEETVELTAIAAAPGTRLDHQIRWLTMLRPVLGQLTEDRFGATTVRIAKEILDEERSGLARLCIVGGEAMPPPVVATFGLTAKELACIA